MDILGIDPGTESSAYLVWNGTKIEDKGHLPNPEVIKVLRCYRDVPNLFLSIEAISHYGSGMPVGKEVFDTCIWIGRFLQTWEDICPHWKLVLRPAIKAHFCGTTRAKDANVRQSLIDRVGASGTKKDPGATYGVSQHVWSALAVAVYTHDCLSIISQ